MDGRQGEQLLESEDIKQDTQPQPLPIPEAAEPIDVSKAARQGGVWSIIAYTFGKFSGFASSIVLARLLMPKDFGLIAMVNTVTAIVQVLGYWGVGAVVMYQREDHEKYANTAWWIDVIIGLCLFILANLTAPLAALYYHEPRVRVIILIASLNYLINPLGNMMDVLLRREFRFRESTLITLVNGLVVSILTVIFAFLGMGVWSFVYPSIVAALVTVVLRWWACSFRPSIRVHWELSRKILNFGRHMFGSGVFDYINQNVDYILVGGLFGKTQLGLYLFAYNLGTWIVQNISVVIASILFPTITSVQQDHERASKLFLRLVEVISIVGFPIIAIEWAIAPLYLGSIYGAKWLPCIIIFRLIAVYGMGRAVCNPALSLISAMGRPDINLKVSAATSPILIAAIYIGSRHGINGVALATALAHGLFVWFYVIIPFRVLGWDISRFFKTLIPAFVSSVLAAVLTGFVYSAMGSPSVSLIKLGCLILLGFGSYAGFMLLFFRGTAIGTYKLVGNSLRDARG